jgi:FSR family fosmidomycin resistance protein-like MFS transporter
VSKKNPWLNVTAYSLAHALVDAACIAALFAIVTPNRNDPAGAYQLILIYDVIAFAPQPVFGLLVDAVKAPAKLAAAGMLLVAAGLLLMRAPLLAMVTAGIGNALFHASGGYLSLKLAPGKASLPGIFVAPGAFGLTIGILIGKSGGFAAPYAALLGRFAAWPFLLLLLALAALILVIPPPEDQDRQRQLPGNLRWFETVIVLLLVSVAIRSLVGQRLVLPWKSDPGLLLALTLAVVLGKALGGVLADRYGWVAVAVSGLVVSLPLLAFFAPLPALIILGTFLFNLSMPVTLACLAEMLPGKSGFAFGLTALALILGALPSFMPLRALTAAPGFIFVAILVSSAALYGGLRLYDRHFKDGLPARQRGSQFEEG